MAILYFQQLQNKKIISNYHTDIGRKLQRKNEYLFTDLLYTLRDSIELVKQGENNLFKYVKDNYFFYIYFGESVLGFIADSSLDEKKLNSIINRIFSDPSTDVEKLLNDFNNNHFMDDIADEIVQTKQICSQSLNLILNRGEKIDQLNVLSDELGMKVKKFKKESEKLLGSRVADMFIGLGVVIFIFFLYYFFFY